MIRSTRHHNSKGAIRVALAFGLVLTVSGRAGAQEPVKSFELLNTQIGPGNSVYVTDVEGHETKGRVVEITPGSLRLARSTRVFTAADVRTVYYRPDDSLSTGALWGLGIGAGATSVVFAIICASYRCDAGDAGLLLLHGGLWAGVGAGIGAGIDAAIPWPKRLVYRAPASGTGARLSVAPIITPGAKGAALSVSF
jgi:hypothetical protein